MTAFKQAARHLTQQVRCPQCGAKPQQRCYGTRGLRKASHQQRVEYWRRLRSAA